MVIRLSSMLLLIILQFNRVTGALREALPSPPPPRFPPSEKVFEKVYPPWITHDRQVPLRIARRIYGR